MSVALQDPAVAADVATRHPTLSIVVPCFCSMRIDELVAGLSRVLDGDWPDHEILLVDDGSPDDTWRRLKDVKARYGDRVSCLRLSSNVGQHRALLAGFANIAPSTEIVVTMDDDLQHPPEELPKLLKEVEDGADLVIAAYDTKRHQPWRNLSGRIIDSSLRSIYGLGPEFELTSLRAFRRYVAEHALAMKTDYPYVTAMLLSATTRRRNVRVRHRPRRHGRSGYTVLKSARLALNLYFTYSKYPLFLVLGLALVSLSISVGLGIWVIGLSLLHTDGIPGWASTLTAISFGNSVVLACLSVFGIYISRFSRQLSGVGGDHAIISVKL